ncbi:2-oxo-4-hydroxy-4-carboxy-5-ureidoimidazoline decarboxylase-like [Sitophilus oryzae]|uniref:2-oxo-4-hydroxy-4-carboxy-5-ureidoimidazoline decarboxylase n=1 Tax=Sitophilus oryzae TaxID=7048 RepID=A0A6J2Y3B6_SITOR|nr:2-oxo-4-hydroxy-4-carboxy-5-ureidoimidazoline decarboxylase-like [Sitophilus oryzae]
MWASFLTIQEVNSLESDHFIKIFGNVVEHCLATGIGILKHRPFASVEDIVKAVEEYLSGLKLQDKEKVLQLYPDSVSKLASFSNSMLEFNTHQKIVNNTLSSLRFEEKKRLKQLCRRYKEKNEFPFIFCSKEEDIEKICIEIELRMKNNKEKEIEVAMAEVKKISRQRIYEIVK